MESRWLLKQFILKALFFTHCIGGTADGSAHDDEEENITHDVDRDDNDYKKPNISSSEENGDDTTIHKETGYLQ